MYGMSLLCALMVVAMHIGGGRAGELSGLVMQLIGNGICRVAVPFFFFAAGFWLSRHVEEPHWYGRELRKRILSILVPYLLCSFFWLLFELVEILFANARACRPLLANFETGWRFLRYIGFYPFDYPSLRPLWFLRALLVMFVLSPVILFLLRKSAIAFLATSFCTAVYCNSFLEVFSSVWHIVGTVFSAVGLFYFSAGMFCGLHKRVFVLMLSCFAAKFTLAIGIIGVSLPKFCNNIRDLVSAFNDLSVPFLVVGFLSMVPCSGVLQRFASYSFPIYLTHMLPITVFACAVKQTGGIALLVKYLFAVFVSSMFVVVLRRYCPRFAFLIFGGR